MKFCKVAAIGAALALLALLAVFIPDAFAAGVALHSSPAHELALAGLHFVASVAVTGAADLNKLRQERIDAAKKGKALVDQLNALLAKDNATDEEKAKITELDAEVTKLEQQVGQLDARIADEEKKTRRASLFSAPSNLNVRPGARFTSSEPDPATTGGFRSLAHFAVDARSHQLNQGTSELFTNYLAAPTNFEQNQGAAGEGFLVPTEYRQQIWSLVFGDNDILGLCNPEPTSGNSISIPKDETTPWGSSGVQSKWRAEGSQMVASKFAATGTLLELHELYAFCLATNEVLNDAPRLNNRLSVQAANAIRWQASEAVIWGDGNGKPLGFMKAACLVTVAKDAAQAAATVSLNNVLGMYARLLAQGGRPVWAANRDTLPQLAQLTVGNVPAWLPLNQPMRNAPEEGVFLGRALVFNEHMQTLGTLGDIVVADLSGYALATKIGGGIDFAASIHLFFDYGMSAFRWTFRVGGQPYLSAAVSPAKGSSTKSHFVALATRA